MGAAGKVTGDLTNTRKVRQDPAYKKIRNQQVKRYIGIKTAAGTEQLTYDNPDYPKGTPVTNVYNDKGSWFAEVPSRTGEPGAVDIVPFPPIKSRRGINEQELIDKKSEKLYRNGVIAGTIEPDPDIFPPGSYTVERQDVETTSTPSKTGTDTGKRLVDTDSRDPGQIKDYEGGVSDGVYEAEADAEEKATPKLNPELDPNTVDVLVFNEYYENGEVIPNSGGVKFLTADEIDKLKDEGRIKSSIAQKAKKKLRGQKKANEKGNWPIPEGYGFNSSGDLIPIGSEGDVSNRTASGKNADDNTPETVVPTGQRLSSPGTVVSGVPSENKVRLFVKDPTQIEAEVFNLLRSTGNGIVFPYTPTINWNYSANYGTFDIVHSNYQTHFYNMTPNPAINLTSTWTANTTQEAEYMAACLHFLKWATKSDFGAYENGPGTNRNLDAGTPPPVLVFSGYGGMNAKNVPVIIRNVNYTYPEDVDYVTIGEPGTGRMINGIFYTHDEVQEMNVSATEFNDGEYGAQRKAKPLNVTTVPTQLIVQIDLGLQYPPSYIRDEFNIKRYADGTLLKNKGII